MLTVLADALFTATRNERDRCQWSDRFLRADRKRMEDSRRYRFSPYRDLW